MKNKMLFYLTKYKRHLLSFTLIVFLFVFFKAFNFSSTSPDLSYANMFNANYKVFALTIPKDLNFAGEVVPQNDFFIRENLDRELLVNTYWQSNSLLIHKRANRWFPVIESILKKNNIPEDFKYVAAVESGLTHIVSPQKAVGYWQLIETTATSYGLEVTEDVDERYNIEKSTEAACRYFKEAYEKFGSWTLVAASYNMGITGLASQLEKQQVKSYYDLLLNEETSRYVFRVLAMKEIISRPKAYGFLMRKRDLYMPIQTTKIKVDSTVTDLVAFAQNKGVTYKTLKTFNPWLRKSSLPNPNHKVYYIELPLKKYSDYDFDEEFTDVTINTPADSLQYLNVNADTVLKSNQ